MQFSTMLWKIDMFKNLTIYEINSMQVLKELEAGVRNNKILSDLFFDVEGSACIGSAQ